MRFVLGVHVVAESLALGIKHAGDMVGGLVLAQPTQHIDHSVDCTRGNAVSIAQIRHRMKGSVQIARAIHQQQGLVHRLDYRRVPRHDWPVEAGAGWLTGWRLG